MAAEEAPRTFTQEETLFAINRLQLGRRISKIASTLNMKPALYHQMISTLTAGRDRELVDLLEDNQEVLDALLVKSRAEVISLYQSYLKSRTKMLWTPCGPEGQIQSLLRPNTGQRDRVRQIRCPHMNVGCMFWSRSKTGITTHVRGCAFATAHRPNPNPMQ